MDLRLNKLKCYARWCSLEEKFSRVHHPISPVRKRLRPQIGKTLGPKQTNVSQLAAHLSTGSFNQCWREICYKVPGRPAAVSLL